MAKKKILVTETALRDAHQSLIATRMPIEDMLPILDKMDKIGYHSLECWGGATFDSCLRFLDEDPWDRLRLIRKKCPNTKLQMLFRPAFNRMIAYLVHCGKDREHFLCSHSCCDKRLMSVTQYGFGNSYFCHNLYYSFQSRVTH